jgi:hypothetical protein
MNKHKNINFRAVLGLQSTIEFFSEKICLAVSEKFCIFTSLSLYGMALQISGPATRQADH